MLYAFFKYTYMTSLCYSKRINDDKSILNLIDVFQRFLNFELKDKYPNFEVGLKCIIMVF